MNKLFRFSEIVYWIIVALCVIEVYLKWEANPQRAKLFLVFGIVSAFMALFRRRWRKRFQNRDLE